MSSAAEETIPPVVHAGQVLVYPSALVRPVPGFHIQRPDGWVVVEMPQAVLTMGSTELTDGVWVNAAVMHERVLPTMSLEVAAAASWTGVKDMAPGATVQDERLVAIGARKVYLRGNTLPATDTSPAIAQVHSIFFGIEEGHPTADLFQIVCTCAEDRIDDLMQVFMDVSASFTFT